jgi:hypothetical protein
VHLTLCLRHHQFTVTGLATAQALSLLALDEEVGACPSKASAVGTIFILILLLTITRLLPSATLCR